MKTSVASFTKEANLGLTKHPLKINWRLANRGLTSLVKEGTGVGVSGYLILKLDLLINRSIRIIFIPPQHS